jgi:tetratricopeptide (TPR) repeat protein
MLHQRNGKGLRWEIKPGNVDHAFVSRPAAPGDVHLALLGLRLLSVNPLVQDRVSRPLLEEAAAEDPGHPFVVADLARVRKEPPLPALRAAVARRPDDGRGWYLLGLDATEADERDAALRKAVALWSNGALAQAALASHLAATGRAWAALTPANRAVELAPWSPTTVSSLATVALELGQCKQALILQQRAIETVQAKRVGSGGSDFGQMKEQLAAIEKRCPPLP